MIRSDAKKAGKGMAAEVSAASAEIEEDPTRAEAFIDAANTAISRSTQGILIGLAVIAFFITVSLVILAATDGGFTFVFIGLVLVGFYITGVSVREMVTARRIRASARAVSNS